MGAGVAQVALQAGIPAVVLYDPSEPQRTRAQADIRAGLEKLVAKGKATADVASRADTRLQLVGAVDGLAGCDLVIEAVPEDLALKQDLFAQLDALLDPRAILATNTSSLSVTAVAASTRHPERVVGLHFFNPVPLMALVEVISGHRTDPDVADRTLRYAEALGKVAVRAADTPGFIVNRVARPFYLEGLRLLGEGVADHATLDRILRLAGGFRMGPFELMDLIGIDVNFAVTRSVYHAFFEDPKYRPHPIQARMVHAGSLGRKSGRGFYAYPQPEAVRTEHKPSGRHERVLLLGDKKGEFAERIEAAGHLLVPPLGDRSQVTLVLDAQVGPLESKRQALLEVAVGLDPRALILTNGAAVAATEVTSWLSGFERVAAFGMLGTRLDQRLVECSEPLGSSGLARAAVEDFWASLGLETAWVADRSGLVTPRVVACLINEAYSALMEGVASESDLEQAMTLGVNYPRGLFAWARRIGLASVVQVLEGLQREQGDDRYRTTPLLRLEALARMDAVLAPT